MNDSEKHEFTREPAPSTVTPGTTTPTEWYPPASALATAQPTTADLDIDSIDRIISNTAVDPHHFVHKASDDNGEGSYHLDWRPIFDGSEEDDEGEVSQVKEESQSHSYQEPEYPKEITTPTPTLASASASASAPAHQDYPQPTQGSHSHMNSTSYKNYQESLGEKSKSPKARQISSSKKKSMTEVGYGVLSTEGSTSGDLSDIVKRRATVSHSLTSANTTPKGNTNSKNDKKLDEYGFIVNLDTQGIIRRSNSFSGLRGGAYTPPPPGDHRPLASLQKSSKSKQRNGIRRRHRRRRNHTNRSNRRERKWLGMLENWESILQSPNKASKLRARIRKGIPNSVRGEAWAKLAGVPRKVDKTKVGVYASLVEKSCGKEIDSNDDSNGVDRNVTVSSPFVPSVQSDDMAAHSAMKDTIERDINRTFPRHSMFYDDDSSSNSDSDSSFDEGASVGSSLIEGYESTPSTDAEYMVLKNSLVKSSSMDEQHWTQEVIQKAASSCPSKCTTFVKCDNGDGSNGNHRDLLITGKGLQKGKKVSAKKEVDFMLAQGGQASLRRILRAYSIYDPEVGYCQGMNFIAGMFITYMTEEEAFWTLVAVMQEKPCRMRGLFSEGMNEAHQVLYIAEKLIAQFHPRLSRHFARENVHITMFATQWLLTIYTSSFPFDVVTRVWDCFLTEGWKVAYRVMLALLEKASPHLIRLRFEDILGYLKELPNEVNASEIIDMSFKIKVKKRHISKLAKEWEKSQK